MEEQEDMRTTRFMPFLLALALSANIAPAFAANCSLDKFDGPGKLELSQFRGRVVYVDFWASWCGPCKQSFPFMNDIKKKYEAKGITVVAISTDEKKADATEFLKDQSPKFIVAHDADGSCAKTLGVKSMPSSYILGKNGEVIYTHKGFRPSDMAEITKQLDLVSDK